MSQEQYKIFDSFAEGVQVLSPEGEYLYVNDAVALQGKRTKEELLGSNIKKEYPGFEQTEAYDKIQKCHKDQTRQIMVNEFEFPDKSIGYFMLRMDPIEDGILIMSTDITDLRQKERDTTNQQIREYEHKLTLFVEHSPAALAMFDTEMRYILTSKRWVKDYGLSEEQLTGKSHYEIFPTIPDRWKEIHKKCLAGTSAKCKEDSFTGADGTIVWLSWEIHPWYKANGQVGGIIMFTEVITDRVEARLKYQTLVEKSLVGVYIIKGNKFVYVNPKIVEHTGFSEEEMMNIDFEKFIHPEDLPVVQKHMQERLSGSVNDAEYEVRVFNNRGETLWLHIMGTTTTYEGSPAIMGTMVNITDKKLLELERKKIIDDLVARNRDLEQFSNILSHNLRAPISTILGLTGLFNQEQEIEDVQAIIKGVEQSASQLDNVIKDLNEILRVKHTLTEIKVDVSLEDIANEAKALLNHAIEDKEAIIEFNFSKAPKLNTVRSYMSSIFYNLISNALKYAQTNANPVIKISSDTENGNTILTFKDNGIGIDLDKHKNQLFGLYKRFHAHIEGKGLGLFIVKTQVDALQGTIDVTSKPNEGTEFILSFKE